MSHVREVFEEDWICRSDILGPGVRRVVDFPNDVINS